MEIDQIGALDFIVKSTNEWISISRPKVIAKNLIFG